MSKNRRGTWTENQGSSKFLSIEISATSLKLFTKKKRKFESSSSRHDFSQMKVPTNDKTFYESKVKKPSHISTKRV